MGNQYERSQRLLGAEGMAVLGKARVAVFGIGGVGAFVCEALVRNGVKKVDLIDHDRISLSNLNRQLHSLHSTVGRSKVEVMKERLNDICPDGDFRTYPIFFLPENSKEFPFDEYDYVVDAVDTVTAKLEIIMKAERMGIPVISAMGAGNKMDPSAFMVQDIYKTKMDPLAKVMRKELKKRGVKKLKVVYSEEKPMEIKEDTIVPLPGKRQTPGSMSFVPGVVGMIIAGEIVKDLLKIEQ